MDNRYLTHKLDFLEEQRGHLHNAVDDYVDVVINAGKQWTESEGQRPKYMDLLLMIDSSVEFLFLKHTELSAESSKCSDQSSKKVVATRQIDLGRRSEQLSPQEIGVYVTHNNVPTNTLKRLEQNEEQVKKMMEPLDQVKNHESQLQNLQQQLQNLSENHDELQNLKNEVQKLLANERELQNLKKEVHKLSKNQDKLHNLKKKVQRVTASQDELQDEINSRISEDMEKKLTVMSNETNRLRDFVKSALDKTDSYMEALSIRTESLEKATISLSETSSTNNKTIKERNKVKSKEIDEKLVLLETGETDYLISLATRLEDSENNSKILSHMLAKRMQPLEQLRQIFNERSKVRDENAKKLQDLMNKVTAMTPKIADLEMQSSKPVIGFSAVAAVIQAGIGDFLTVANYEVVVINEGCHFNPLSGVFTAPVDAVYVISVVIECPKDIHCIVKVMYDIYSKNCVGCCKNGTHVALTSGLWLVKMKTGDQLFAQIIKYASNIRPELTLSCFMIG